ncbi:MAG: DUF2147 domain-containing protein [Proteobacteria bacterium]|jgi:uncharacterized protein (DUF2147 family)|nr:DUF2147 domain-containing protein [Pseudomonadota bacterium]
MARRHLIDRRALIAPAALVALLVTFGTGAQAPAASAKHDADPTSPVGFWITVDDKTGDPRSVIRIWKKSARLYGTIVKLIDPRGGNPNPRCYRCPGALRGKHVVGMTIINGLAQDGGEWSGGTIIDPESGKTYKMYIQVINGGKKLKVRGYLGIALLGRTQYWIRAR